MARNGRGILSLETLEDSKFFIEIDGKSIGSSASETSGFEHGAVSSGSMRRFSRSTTGRIQTRKRALRSSKNT